MKLTVFFLTILLGMLAVQPTALWAESVTADNLPKAGLLKSLVLDAQLDAQKPYIAPEKLDNQTLLDMDYATYRSIRFNPEKSLWRGEHAHEVQFFHDGFLYDTPVSINLIKNKKVTPFRFNADLFHYDGTSAKLASAAKQNAGFVGFRLHYPINGRDYKDEYAVFQGATYFRLIGKQQNYGLSARAVAINTGLPQGEEFPYFSEFWLSEPNNKKEIRLYARINSPSLTGVMSMLLTPGENTRTKINTWLFARTDITKLGLAPFTSMYYYGENTVNKPDDFRSEIHDSDGLAMLTHANERIWRVLDNPGRIRTTSLSDIKPKGFGLLQRDTQFSHYLDAEANYHKRPGLWLTPLKGFTDGHVELVEIPTQTEFDDNMVAYWVSNKPVKKGNSVFVSYELSTINGNVAAGTQLSVLRTLNSEPYVGNQSQQNESNGRRYVVDFANVTHTDFSQQLKAELTIKNGEYKELRVFPIDNNSAIRATFIVTQSKPNLTADMRLYLTHKDQRISETWNALYEH